MSLVNSHFSNVNLFPADGLSHESREWLPAYFIPLEFFTTILLGVRLLSRFQWEKSRLGLDDLFITMAWAIGVVNTSLSLDGMVEPMSLMKHLLVLTYLLSYNKLGI